MKQDKDLKDIPELTPEELRRARGLTTKELKKFRQALRRRKNSKQV